MSNENNMPGLPRPYVYYVEFYVKLSFADGDDAYYHYETDAAKPVTEDFLARLLASTWEAQSDMDPARTVVAAKYVTRTEWESACEKAEPRAIPVDLGR